MELFSREFFIQNIIIAIIVSVFSNFLSDYIKNNRNYFIDLLNSKNITIITSISYFIGLVFGMGGAILLNEGFENNIFLIYISKIGFLIFGFSMIMSFFAFQDKFPKFFRIGFIVVGVMFIYNAFFIF